MYRTEDLKSYLIVIHEHTHEKPEVTKGDREINKKIRDAAMNDYQLTPKQASLGKGTGGIPLSQLHPKYSNTSYVQGVMRKGKADNKQNPYIYEGFDMASVRKCLHTEVLRMLEEHNKSKANSPSDYGTNIQEIIEGFKPENYIVGYMFQSNEVDLTNLDEKVSMNILVTMHTKLAELMNHCVFLNFDSTFSETQRLYLHNVSGFDPFRKKWGSLSKSYSNTKSMNAYYEVLKYIYIGYCKKLNKEIKNAVKKFYFAFDGDDAIHGAELRVLQEVLGEEEGLITFVEKITSCITHLSGRKNKVVKRVCNDEEDKRKFEVLYKVMLESDDLEKIQSANSALVELFPGAKGWANRFISPRRLVVNNRNLFANPKQFFQRSSNGVEITNKNDCSRLNSKNLGPAIVMNMRLEKRNIIDLMNVKNYSMKTSYTDLGEQDRALKKYKRDLEKRNFKEKVSQFAPQILSSKSGPGRNSASKRKRKRKKTVIISRRYKMNQSLKSNNFDQFVMDDNIQEPEVLSPSLGIDLGEHDSDDLLPVELPGSMSEGQLSNVHDVNDVGTDSTPVASGEDTIESVEEVSHDSIDGLVDSSLGKRKHETGDRTADIPEETETESRGRFAEKRKLRRCSGGVRKEVDSPKLLILNGSKSRQNFVTEKFDKGELQCEDCKTNVVRGNKIVPCSGKSSHFGYCDEVIHLECLNKWKKLEQAKQDGGYGVKKCFCNGVFVVDEKYSESVDV